MSRLRESLVIYTWRESPSLASRMFSDANVGSAGELCRRIYGHRAFRCENRPNRAKRLGKEEKVGGRKGGKREIGKKRKKKHYLRCKPRTRHDSRTSVLQGASYELLVNHYYYYYHYISLVISIFIQDFFL